MLQSWLHLPRGHHAREASAADGADWKLRVQVHEALCACVAAQMRPAAALADKHIIPQLAAAEYTGSQHLVSS